MSNTKDEVKLFLSKCGELKKCKFIMATTKIKDLLKCIVNSPELYRLFDTVTKNFDYVEQKSKCLVTADDGYFRKKCVILPSKVGQRLAFIFCLLVEFDRDTINFNNFLQTYFPEDGSYFASYQAFCRTIISSLEDLIRQVFKAQLESEDERDNFEETPEYRLLTEIESAISAEKEFLLNSRLTDEEKNNGCNLLEALLVAVKSGDEKLIDALISGYNYFILYNKCVSDGVAPLIESLAEFEELL